MANGKDLHRIALSFDGTTEAPHFDRAAFKVARIYATLAADSRTANLKLSPDEQEFKCMMAPEAFAPVGGAWGKQGWTHGHTFRAERGGTQRRARDGMATRRAQEACAAKMRFARRMSEA